MYVILNSNNHSIVSFTQKYPQIADWNPQKPPRASVIASRNCMTEYKNINEFTK